MRSPTSGGGRKHPQPDLLASRNGKELGIECKSTGKDRVYIDKSEIVQLKGFCDRFDAYPLIAVRFNYEGWFFLEVSALVETGKNYKISKKTAKRNGLRAENFFSSAS